MKTVMHILTDSNIGGAGMWVLNSAPAMGDEFDVYVVLPEGAMLIKRLRKVMASDHIVEVKHISDRSFSVQGVRTLNKVIQQYKPDVIHTHASLAGRLAGKFRGVKIINSRHCVEPVSAGLKGWIKKVVNNQLSHRIIAVSEAIHDNLLASGAVADKVILLLNGVKPIEAAENTEINGFKKKAGISKETFVIGYIGRLEPVKGTSFLTDVASQLLGKTDRPFKMVVAGDGSEKDLLYKLIKEKSLEDHIHCLGQVEDIQTFYSSIDVLINVSRSEGIPMSLIEGMSRGLPLVAFDVGSLHQLIHEGENGWLVEAFDCKTYADRIAELMDNMSLRQQFGECSKRIMYEHFHVDEMNRKLGKIYREVSE